MNISQNNNEQLLVVTYAMVIPSLVRKIPNVVSDSIEADSIESVNGLLVEKSWDRRAKALRKELERFFKVKGHQVCPKQLSYLVSYEDYQEVKGLLVQAKAFYEEIVAHWRNDGFINKVREYVERHPGLKSALQRQGVTLDVESLVGSAHFSFDVADGRIRPMLLGAETPEEYATFVKNAAYNRTLIILNSVEEKINTALLGKTTTSEVTQRDLLSAIHRLKDAGVFAPDILQHAEEALSVVKNVGFKVKPEVFDIFVKRINGLIYQARLAIKTEEVTDG